MADYSYQYDICFHVDYDPAVLEASESPDKYNTELQTNIQNKVAELKSFLQFQPGIRELSSFVSFGAYRYKVDLYRE